MGVVGCEKKAVAARFGWFTGGRMKKIKCGYADCCTIVWANKNFKLSFLNGWNILCGIDIKNFI